MFDDDGFSTGIIYSEVRRPEKSTVETESWNGEVEFNTVFERSPVSMWEEDFSEAREYVESLGKMDSEELSKFLEKNPEELASVASRIKIVDVNRAALKTLKAKDKGFFIENYSMIFCEETAPDFIDFIAKVMRGDTESDGGLEVAAQTFNGEKLTLNLSWNVAPDCIDSFSRLWFYAIDITERKVAEERLKVAASVATDLIYEWDVETDTLEWFGDIDGALGYEKGRVGSDINSFLSIIHPEDRSRLEKAIDLHRSINRPIHEEYRVKSSSGRWLYWTDRAAPVLNSMGAPVKWIGVCSDVTENRHTRIELQQHRENLEQLILERSRELHDSQARFRRLSDNLPDIIMRWIPNYGLDYVNSAIERVLGLKPVDLIGNWGCFMSHVHPEDVDELTGAFQEMGQGKKDHQTTEYRFITDDGRTVWLEAIWRPIWNEDRTTLYSVEAIARDITDRKNMEAEKERLQQQLIQSQKMEALGALAGGVAHDFNNIIAAISGTAEVLLLKVGEDPGNSKKVQRILNSSRRARDLTMKMLTFARQEKLDIRRENANSIVNDVLDILGETVSKKIIFERKLAGDLKNFTVDSTQILQALLNICINACDAMPGGGVLGIRTANVVAGDDETEYCLIEVTDSGNGIAPEIRGKIFEPFFTTKERGKGSGLGLSVSHGIVEAHGGRMELKDNECGCGTVARIFIPVMGEGDDVVQEETSQDLEGKSTGRVLVIDDDEDFVDMTSEALEMLGFEVLISKTGKSAVETYRSRMKEIDIIMLDMMLPEMDGAEIFHALRSINPSAKIVLCSGFSQEGDATNLLEEGANAYVQKPFNLADLNNTFNRVIKRGGTGRA